MLRLSLGGNLRGKPVRRFLGAGISGGVNREYGCTTCGHQLVGDLLVGSALRHS
jgi:hypothetical protein